jgi:hypothetical protein
MASKFRNKQLYTDVFPEFQTNLIGTEYAPPQQQQPPLQRSKQAIKERFGEVPLSKKKPLLTLPKQPTVIPEPIDENLQTKYDPTLHYTTPKSELDLPLQIALKATYPEQLIKVKDDLNRYGYFINSELTDPEHIVIHNPQKKITIFGVRGTNLESSSDVFTDISLPFSAMIGKDIKTYDRYKQAEKKYEEVKKAYPNTEIIRVGHSLGGTIQSVMSKANEKTYTYNRLYGPYDVKPNEIAISVESDPLFIRKSEDKKKIIQIPRTYYEKARDYVALKKAKIPSEYEEKPIIIPEKYKTDEETVVYKQLMKKIPSIAMSAYNVFSSSSPLAVTTANAFGYWSPLFANQITQRGTEIAKRYENSHSIENLPLSIRVEPSKKRK